LVTTLATFIVERRWAVPIIPFEKFADFIVQRSVVEQCRIEAEGTQGVVRGPVFSFQRLD